MLRGLWAAYERSLASRPVLTQAATSSVLWGLGDCLAQRIEAYERAHYSGIAADITLGSAMAGSSAGTAAAAASVDEKTSNDSDALAALDTHRVAATATFGAAFIGPVGHAWYLGLEGGCRRLFPAGGSAFLAAKVAVDSVGMGSLYVASFFAFGSMVLERSGWEGFVRKMQIDFLPTYAAELAVWPLVQAANFALVPVRHQLLVVNSFSLLDAAFISWAGHQEGWLDTLRARLGW